MLVAMLEERALSEEAVARLQPRDVLVALRAPGDVIAAASRQAYAVRLERRRRTWAPL